MKITSYTLCFFCSVILILSILNGCGAQENSQSVSREAFRSKEKTYPDRQSVAALSTPFGNPLPRAVSTAIALDVTSNINKTHKGFSSWIELKPALQRSLEYARGWSPDRRAVEHSGLRITWSDIVTSLLLLEKLLPHLDEHPELLAQHFRWFRIEPDVRFTGYYSPLLKASRTYKQGYEYPLYRLPEELAPELASCLPSHTCPEEAFVQIIKPNPPYYSRSAIDLDGVLRNRDLEMAWLQHPVDTYDLMLEGSGILDFDDGTRQAALFAGLNGHSGQSMAGYLIRTGQLSRSTATMQEIRRWWDAHPKQRRKFLDAASSYVFFRYGAKQPRGTAGCALTPWISMAVDPRLIPLGGILAYDIPIQGKGALYGLGFAHDTGGAITLRRIDMYTGEGKNAHKEAMRIYNKGHAWLLLSSTLFEKDKSIK